jgi:asparagine synthase (glutamine-hydrolysing)
MSGILGIWNLDGCPVEPEVLSRMGATLAHRGPDGEAQWIEGPVGLACQLMRVTPESLQETQPLVHPSGPVIVFDGRIDNREELLGLLRGNWGAEQESPDPALVLAAYEAFGDRCPERLNGDFALAIYDPGKKQLLLATDVTGLRPLYYHQYGDTFIFASEIKAILAHPKVSPRPNEGLISAFLMRTYDDYFPGETFFAGILSVFGGHLLILTLHGLTVRQYWDFDTTCKIRFKSFSDYAEAFRQLFEQAVRRRLRSAYPVACALSGGLDSSAIFCQAETLRSQAPSRYPPLVGISFTTRDYACSHEEIFLEAIEQFYGVTVDRIPVGPMGYVDNLQQEVWYGETPFLEWDVVHGMEDAARQRGARVLFFGLWGDEFLFGHNAYLVDLFRGLKWREIKEHLQEFKQWTSGIETDPTFYVRQFYSNLVKSHIPELILPWVRRLRSSLAPSKGSPWNLAWHSQASRKMALQRLSVKKPVNYKSFASANTKSLYKLTKGNIIRMEWWKKMASWHGMELAIPFLDRDLVAFLLAIPGDMVVYRGVPKAILRFAMQGILPEAIRQRRSKGNYTPSATDGLDIVYPRIKELVQTGGMAVRGGFIRQGELAAEFEKQRKRLQKGDESAGYAYRNLLYLWGLELWLRAFLKESEV